jgi:16S rRNA (uracil1498-N3)-methyltransferase
MKPRPLTEPNPSQDVVSPMNLPRHFVDLPMAIGSQINLPPSIAHHVGKVTRMRDGDFIALFNADGNFYIGSLQFTGKTECRVLIGEVQSGSAQSRLKITLIQGVSSSEKMAWSIEKATELGAAKIVPIQCIRSVSQIKDDKIVKKQAHWSNIAISASAQCGRSTVPLIVSPVDSLDTKALLAVASEHELNLVLDPLAQASLSAWIKQQANANASIPMSVAIYVGPEGGLTADEIGMALKAGFTSISLGPRILRTETAGPAAIAALHALIGDF